MKHPMILGVLAVVGLFIQPGHSPETLPRISAEQWALYATIAGAGVAGFYKAIKSAAKQANVDAGLQPKEGEAPRYYERIDNLKSSLDSLTDLWTRNRESIERRFGLFDERQLRAENRIDGLTTLALKGDVDRVRIEALLTDVKNMSEIMKRDLKALAGKEEE